MEASSACERIWIAFRSLHVINRAVAVTRCQRRPEIPLSLRMLPLVIILDDQLGDLSIPAANEQG